MDIVSIPGSRILEISRVAFATPDVDFLCFGEFDQPSSASAHAAAAIAALDAGDTRYADVRGLPELRCALADYLTRLHASPVAEERIQVTASGMTAVSIALAATVRAGDRVVLHSPSWPNVGNAARAARRRGGRARPDRLARGRLPHGSRPAGRDAGWRARLHPEQPEQSHRLDRDARRTGDHPGDRPPAPRLADLGRGLFAPGLRRRAGRAVDAGHRRTRRPRHRLQQLLQDLDDDRLAARLAGGARGHARRRSPNWWR